jgi:DNA excision repair protein ERCC-6
MGSSKGKVKRIRKWSSDESDGELIHVNWFEKKKKKKLNKRILSDDGDDELYRQRMKKYKEDSSISNEMIEVEDGYRVPADIWDRLYRYQQTGVKWLWELHCQQVGGILGDEMGLGKTIQVIGFLAGLRCSNVRSHVTRELGLGPVLVVCPATVLYQWVNEFHKWYPPFRVAILHDTGSHGGNKLTLLANIIRYNGVIITTYASIRINNLLLLKYQWDYVILDEGHKIRNPDAEITLACKRVNYHYHRCCYYYCCCYSCCCCCCLVLHTSSYHIVWFSNSE